MNMDENKKKEIMKDEFANWKIELEKHGEKKAKIEEEIFRLDTRLRLYRRASANLRDKDAIKDLEEKIEGKKNELSILSSDTFEHDKEQLEFWIDNIINNEL